MVISKTLSDFSVLKNDIVSKVSAKNAGGLFDSNLHDIFRNQKGKRELTIGDVANIIEAIERKIRQAEIIYYTFFDTSYNNTVLFSNSLSGDLLIETEFSYDTKVITSSIKINDSNAYIELINSNFQSFILLIASIHENICKLVEHLVKKITVHEGDSPYQSITLTRLMKNWDNLVELGYKKNDVLYTTWLSLHRPFFIKYLSQINSLRNSFIHGFSANLLPEFGYYMVKNYDNKASGFQEQTPRVFIPELASNEFVKKVMLSTQTITKELLTILSKKLKYGKQKLPM